MDSARGARLGGAEAWSLAEVWALAGSLRGPGFSLAWPPPSSGTGRTPRLQPPGHRPLSCAARLRRRAGTEPADRAGQCRHQGSIIHGAPGRAPKTSSVLGFSGGVETTRGKSSQSKVGHISYFPKSGMVRHTLQERHVDFGGFEVSWAYTGSSSEASEGHVVRPRLRISTAEEEQPLGAAAEAGGSPEFKGSQDRRVKPSEKQRIKNCKQNTEDSHQ
ncbi:uncharacterized protein LOC110342360 [Mesocricetus auratus]|uniref:Uncharacterized protein LOC110342360 n=1 Tax=Mesocricetus auratus TaxID=10036 RepID=A0A3Q0D233_MESAU|nr:uncharacterized protein LOC110342360 [Mesocricetus auratus]